MSGISKSSTIFLFDVDGTLTNPRSVFCLNFINFIFIFFVFIDYFYRNVEFFKKSERKGRSCNCWRI